VADALRAGEGTLIYLCSVVLMTVAICPAMLLSSNGAVWPTLVANCKEEEHSWDAHVHMDPCCSLISLSKSRLLILNKSLYRYCQLEA